MDGRGGSANQAVGVGAGLGLAAWRPGAEHDGAFDAVDHDMLDHAVEASLQRGYGRAVARQVPVEVGLPGDVFDGASSGTVELQREAAVAGVDASDVVDRGVDDPGPHRSEVWVAPLEFLGEGDAPQPGGRLPRIEQAPIRFHLGQYGGSRSGTRPARAKADLMGGKRRLSDRLRP